MQPGGVYMCGRVAAGCNYVFGKAAARAAAGDSKVTKSEGVEANAEYA
jgi:hypothetical protein